ncbi:MAG: nucleoside deaminase [Desulfobacteraceae bacterium]|nr:MAG: nucleoside deaminase [Desulfobacteraceae bacterium]
MVVVFFFLVGDAATHADLSKLAVLEQRIQSASAHPDFPDDVYGLIVINQALTSLKAGSGGIGACLVNSRTGQVIETGRNRQHAPHFRSDLHGEMDLLNRYEDRAQKTRDKTTNPRECRDLVLVSSMEPCPMCLTRIINSGIKTMIYVAEDPDGGMVSRMDQLPPFWQAFAADREYRKAKCSPDIEQLAMDLFNYSNRSFARNRKNQKNKIKP